MTIKCILCIIAIALICINAAQGRGTPKGVHVSLSSKWLAQPLLHEAAEFLADESPQAFWDFVQHWKSPDTAAHERQCWNALKEQASNSLSPMMSRILKVSLSLRQYSPRLEAFRHLAASAPDQPAEDTCCWAVIGNTIATDAGEIPTAVSAAVAGRSATHASILPIDHIYPSTAWAGVPPNISDTSLIPAVLYGSIGSFCSSAMDSALRTAADSRSNLAYAWRPLLRDTAACAQQTDACASLGAGEHITLHGYGVELAIKNMEYNAKDDTKAPEAEPAAEGSTDSNEKKNKDDAPSSLPFLSLINRIPNLRNELVDFKEFLTSAASHDYSFKGWDFSDIAMQTIEKAIASSDPLHFLGEISQNFPLMIESLSDISVGMQLRNVAEELAAKVPTNANFMAVNGLLYDTENFNLYDFVETLRKEVRLMDALAAAGLSPASARQAAILRGTQAGSQGDASNLPGLDIRPDAEIGEVLWVNNIEKDALYAEFPRQLSAVVQAAYTGQMPYVRRNIFTALFVFDPATPHALSLGPAISQMMQQRWPIRMGLVPVIGDASKSSAEALKYAKILNGIAMAQDGNAAVEFLRRISGIINPNDLVLKSDALAKKLLPIAENAFLAMWDKWNEKSDAAQGVEVPIDGPKSAEEALGELLDTAEGTTGAAAHAYLEASTALVSRKGLGSSLENGGAVVVLNGVVTAVDESGNWRAALGNVWQGEMQSLIQSIYTSKIKETSNDLYGDILKLKGTIPRYNPRAMATGTRGRRSLSLTAATEEQSAPRQVALMGEYAGFKAISELSIKYFGPSANATSSSIDNEVISDYDEDYWDDEEQEEKENAMDAFKGALVTHWVVVDAINAGALQLAADALQHESSLARVGILINPSSSDDLKPVEKLVTAIVTGIGAFSTASKADIVDVFAELAAVKTSSLAELTFDELTKQLPVNLGSRGSVSDLITSHSSAITAIAAKHQVLLRRGLNIGAGVSAVVTNGRVMELRHAGDIVEEDFQLLDIGAAKNQFADKGLAKILVPLGDITESASDIAAVLSSVLTAFQPEDANPNAKALQQILGEYRSSPLMFFASSSLSATGDSFAAPLLIQALLNPLGKTSQRIASLFDFLRSTIDPDVEVLVHPEMDYQDMPLKTFYTYVVPNGDIDANPPSTSTVAATFDALPLHMTLTLGMDVPEGWLVEPIKAAYDLDNLHLDEIPSTDSLSGYAITAEFELEALMVVGMCVDTAAIAARNWDSVHPRGVQLQLGTAAEPAAVDTLVMANLGYFQLKSGPGVWQLRLAPGRSQDLYQISASTAASSTPTAAGALLPAPTPSRPEEPLSVPVAVSGFGDREVLLVLRKDPERMDEDVLDPDGTFSSNQRGGKMWSKMAAKLSPTAPAAVDTRFNEDDTIHVFTVASGHMYERLQKIMILSALKRTKNKLKFWFIKNYMSPAMKEFVPIMAEQYGFEYEFVTYKWPTWLHKQTEKQRTIWAYKILFLDVLFPLGLKKVIFCDSDQVIRADLKELWTMDLQGAPYGYTPFCDTNKEMEGFRFWKQGFWKEHLRGKPYHISALYVIDLERFRALAAGDQLRVIYDSLSKDPNSLSNLDQDLPNYAQDTVPIFSLPQEWLWCETWCGEQTRPAAKTIDLCNNPLTKEPKLQSARRIIAEWPDLNREAVEFTERVDAFLEGKLTEEQLSDTSSRFMAYLEPMVEGSVRTSGDEDDAKLEKPASDGSAHDEL